VIPDYLLLAGRIQQELDDLAQVVTRTERAMQAAQHSAEDSDLFIDAAALNLHDFFAGLERIFQQITTHVDGNIPSGQGWHRQLLIQMQTDLPNLRPPVLSNETAEALDEFLRFRHVVRNVYAFQFDAERIRRLVSQMRPAFLQAQAELQQFIILLRYIAADE
jgi:hypothetical protein